MGYGYLAPGRSKPRGYASSGIVALEEIQTITLSSFENYAPTSGFTLTPVMSGYGPFDEFSLDGSGVLATPAVLASRLQSELETEAAFTGKVTVEGSYGNDNYMVGNDTGYLYQASNTSLQVGSGTVFTWAAWVYVPDDAGGVFYINKDDNATGREYLLRYEWNIFDAAQSRFVLDVVAVGNIYINVGAGSRGLS